MEVWKDIPGYEGLYEASTNGNIRSKEGRTTSNKKFPVRRWKQHVLKGKGISPAGKRVDLWKDGKSRGFLVARLVALTFLGDPPNGFTVNHKDGDRFNNSLENLEWLSLADNIRHGFENGLYSTQKSITISDGKEEHSFRSLAQCDRFLGRRVGYLSNCLKRGTKFTDKQGNIYKQLGG